MTMLTDFHAALLERLIYHIGTVYYNREQEQWDEIEDPCLEGISYQSYVWCTCTEGDELCPCSLPNFVFDGIELGWYKCPQKVYHCNREMSAEEWKNWYERCVKHIWSLDEKEF